MANVVTCPACGEEDSLIRKFDAWACFQITGIGESGELALSDDFDTQVFDDNQIECSNCEKQFDEDEIIQHLASNDETDESE
jgi:hypothetical protein